MSNVDQLTVLHAVALSVLGANQAFVVILSRF